MTILFNYEQIMSHSKNDPNLFIKTFSNFINNKILDQALVKKFTGNSFLLYPKPLIYNKQLDILYKLQYIALASRRSYFLYKTYKAKDLDLSLFPDISIEAIISNPALSIKNNTIKFLYEDDQGK